MRSNQRLIFRSTFLRIRSLSARFVSLSSNDSDSFGRCISENRDEKTKAHLYFDFWSFSKHCQISLILRYANKTYLAPYCDQSSPYCGRRGRGRPSSTSSLPHIPESAVTNRSKMLLKLLWPIFRATSPVRFGAFKVFFIKKPFDTETELRLSQVSIHIRTHLWKFSMWSCWDLSNIFGEISSKIN